MPCEMASALTRPCACHVGSGAFAGPAAGTAGAIVWMAGNLGGLVVALIVQALVHHPLAAFLAMGAISLLGLPLAARLKPVVGEQLGSDPMPVAAG